MKWAICQRHGKIYLEDLPDSKLPERLTGARGHDLDFLLEVSGLRPLLELDEKLGKDFNKMLFWNVALRYKPDKGDVRAAIQFLTKVRELRNWMESIC